MKNNKSKRMSNNSFITNQELIQWMRNKSINDISKVKEINNLSKHKQSKDNTIISNSKYRRDKENISAITNITHQTHIMHTSHNKSIQNTNKQQITKTGIKSIKDIKGVRELLKKVYKSIPQQQIDNQQNIKQCIRVLKLYQQLSNSHKENIKQQNNDSKNRSISINQVLFQKQELKKRVEQLQRQNQFYKHQIQIKSLNKAQKHSQKLHKIIVKQSQVIEKNLLENHSEKEGLLRVILNQSQIIQEKIRQNSNKNIKQSVDLGPYLLNSISCTQSHRYR